MVDELLRAKVQQFNELVALSPHLFIIFGKMTAGKRVGSRGLEIMGISTDHFLKFLYYTSFLTPHDPTSKFST